MKWDLPNAHSFCFEEKVIEVCIVLSVAVERERLSRRLWGVKPNDDLFTQPIPWKRNGLHLVPRIKVYRLELFAVNVQKSEPLIRACQRPEELPGFLFPGDFHPSEISMAKAVSSDGLGAIEFTLPKYQGDIFKQLYPPLVANGIRFRSDMSSFGAIQARVHEQCRSPIRATLTVLANQIWKLSAR